MDHKSLILYLEKKKNKATKNLKHAGERKDMNAIDSLWDEIDALDALIQLVSEVSLASG